MIAAEQVLNANGIHLPSYAPGRQYTTCPQCSAQRSNAHRTLKCLGVTITDNNKVFWGCNHCGWSGPQPGDGNGGGDDREPWPSFLYAGGALRKIKKPKGSRPPPYFWQHRAGSDWERGTGGVDTSALLYRIEEVREAIKAGRIVCCVEGEKDADNLWRLGFAATCNAHGASDPTKNQRPKWTKRHSEQLAGADLVVLNDNDAAGYEHAEVTCRLSLGLALRVRRLDLALHWPDAPKGGDVSDWLNQGHTREELAALIDGAPDYAPAAPSPPPGDGTVKPSSDLARFEMRPEGLYRRDAKMECWKWVAQPFEFFGRCRGPRDAQGVSRGWGRLIRYSDHDGVTCDVIVSDADLHRDVGVLAGDLAEQGFSIANNPAARKAFAEFLNRDANKGRITLAPHTGWLLVDGKPVFILPSGPIGLMGMERERVILRASARAPYETRGSLAEWRVGIGRLAQGNPLALIAISLAFASTLLWLAGYESGGVHVWGPSSVGKTTLARLNASVWGKPAEGGWLRPWRTTANAIEATLAGACDAGLPFDEVAQADAGSFAEMIYVITGGQGKTRMRRDASLRETMTWRALVLSTGEFPIEIKLGESAASRFGGGKHRGGQSVRLVDIKADRELGAFDDVKGMTGAEFVAECQREAATHYGTTGPEFVRLLIERGVTGEDVRGKVAAFLENHLHNAKDKDGRLKWPEVSGQAERVAERFGLIAAAGELATEFGVTPWAAGEATAAAAEIFDHWLRGRGGANPHEERQAIEQVRLFIERYGDSRFDPDLGTDRPAHDRAGWREGESDRRRWYVSTEVWSKEVCAGLDPAFVAKTLAALGISETDPGRVTKVKWRFGKAIRFYVVTPRIFEVETP
jgi:putative DNA primase/helicase